MITNEHAWITRWLVTVAGLGCAVTRLAWAKLTGREPDYWRRILGLDLRSDGTKFVLSAFGLDVFSDLPAPPPLMPRGDTAERHFAARLARFLATAPEARWALRHQSSPRRARATLPSGPSRLLFRFFG